MKRFFLIFILIIFNLFPLFYSEGVSSTNGFIPGQIWYSEDSFIEGDTVKVYTALWNNGTSPLSAKVEFYDKNVILGSRDVIVPSSKLQEVSISWKVTAGDHLISAKIISPSITVSGKKEIITVINDITKTDKRFIPIVINTVEGKPATTSDVLQNQLDKATTSISEILPNSVSNPVSKNVLAIDDFRTNTFESISLNKDLVKKQIEELKNLTNDTNNSNPQVKNKEGETQKVVDKIGIEDATEKPIAYLKLIFLSILSFIFSSKLVFYLLIFFVIFLVIRFIYRKIRNR